MAAVAALLVFFAGGAPAFAQVQPAIAAATASAPAASLDLRTQALLNAVAASARANASVEPAIYAGPPSASPPGAYPQTPYAVTIHREITALGAPSSPLAAMVDANSIGDLDDEANCLATAVYFESKGEPLEGQLAVAQVVMNRAASGRYPPTLCGVVKQHAQFSFVRHGAFPSLDPNCNGWRRAQAIARIAQKHLVPTVPTDVLWYHADYVAPRWRQALVRVEQIGAHIFYRA
ncbi:MAG: cell wall hydrolase [Sphingomicrobium sp.]